MKPINIEKFLKEFKENKNRKFEERVWIEFHKLRNQLEDAQGSATARTVTAFDIERIAENAMKKLPYRLTKKEREGYSVVYNCGAGDFAGAYKYPPMATRIKIEYLNGWKITEIERVNVKNKETYEFYFTELILKKFLRENNIYA